MFSFNRCSCNINFTISITMLLMCQFKYIQWIFSKPLIHQFKCVTNAINDHEFTFNIPLFIHLLLNDLPIVHDVILFLSNFPSYIYNFISNHFCSIISILSIIYFQLHYIAMLIDLINIIHLTLYIFNSDWSSVVFLLNVN